METATIQKITSYLQFKLGYETFTFNVRYVINILEMQKITSVPKTPEEVKGVINLRGKILPVIDLRLKMQMTSMEVTPNTCILVLEVPNNEGTLHIGAMVDSVTGVYEFQDEQIKEPPTTDVTGGNFIKGIIQQENRLILVPDIKSLFTGRDIETIEHLNNNQ